jgi:hypothetical protein
MIMNAPDEKEDLKRAIFERLSPRRRKFIERIGYDRWDPFQEPKDPIETRTDVTRRTAPELMRRFLADLPEGKYSSAYTRGVFEICHGLINNEDRFRGAYEFCLWYDRLLRKEGKSQDFEEQLKL